MKAGPFAFPLAAVSAIFFFLWIAMPVLILSNGAVHTRTVIFAAALVWLIGSVRFLRSVRSESPRGYWGIPFAVVCAALVLWTGAVEGVVAVPGIADRVFLFLLAPAAALFLYAFPDDCRSAVRMPIVAIAGISVVSLFLVYSGFLALTAPEVHVPALRNTAGVLYTLLLMPLVGLLLIVTGARCR